MVKIDDRVPERGDIIRLELNPRTGSEQAGYRPALVISPLAYNRISKLILICPITSRQKGWPFEVALPESLQTYGIILVDQVRSIDCQARNARFVEILPDEVINEVLARLETLLT
ncbi:MULTISPECIES: type II toxin-antitoxin system PemK/MazF family toxin [Crocosphaera]|uniref:Programmed cell death toxin MazF n=6 Tax=Crocosphaera watsonii TaxID=263511 RepID=T2JR45_CROWT|nr:MULTISPECIES: type II toxin-antitoxin system PemK/MazF family toxin [Crocosphaera]EHJ12800.1 Programmed cell death toxin MazF [Crocosphaera watsonii WH 0003]MCH2245586.1 type II toxin-antitoxin system PemK/MazF family toxin [Crocosphaera sp.]NQZ61809.1 type II toxin-antitoxin system PemK/MazF family toxin [Crocosphaera sp.]CCQ52331.1 Programmed cell death toxin MazF [Crocosphaera watsonii WH 8502]CCQ59430.1 Programmed cell death toxin MazF [Crocosphaera watsonii WH 0005]